MTVPIRISTGAYAYTQAFADGSIASDRVRLDYVFATPAHSLFRPFVNGSDVEVSELALVTYLIARDMGRPITMLPVVLMRQPELPVLVCLEDSPIRRIEDLVGARIGVRSFTQTAATWIRGILNEASDFDPMAMWWRTIDASHVEGYLDPPEVVRMPARTDLIESLRARDCDVAVVGLESRSLPGLRPALDDYEAIEADWRTKRRLVPVNHVLCVRSETLEDHPWLGEELVEMFAASFASAPTPLHPTEAPSVGHVENDEAFDAIAEFAFRQRLTSQRYVVEDLFSPV